MLAVAGSFPWKSSSSTSSDSCLSLSGSGTLVLVHPVLLLSLHASSTRANLAPFWWRSCSFQPTKKQTPYLIYLQSSPVSTVDIRMSQLSLIAIGSFTMLHFRRQRQISRLSFRISFIVFIRTLFLIICQLFPRRKTIDAMESVNYFALV